MDDILTNGLGPVCDESNAWKLEGEHPAIRELDSTATNKTNQGTGTTPPESPDSGGVTRLMSSQMNFTSPG